MLTRKDSTNDGASRFEILPAIDLLGDEAVRLERGRFDRVVLREADPVSLARSFVEAGARALHVVDLDGARTGRCRPEVIAALVRAAAPAEVQASGGVRAPADARALVGAGAVRVVVGTAAFAEPDALRAYVEELGERLVVAVDVRGGRIVTRGWTEDAGLGVGEAVERCVEAGVPRLLCSAVERDGTLSGPDLALLDEVVKASGLPVLAAGGVRSLEDVKAVEAVGCAGAIVGRALLEGAIPVSALAS
jgi:phosphoribosylformimino-5-aminoimidazole carboxamide ribotide isomerase